MKFQLDKGTDYPIDARTRISYHPDLGWAIYQRFGTKDWERETELTHTEALEEMKKVWRDSDKIEIYQFDIEWDCPRCSTHNTDNYYASRSVLCDGCAKWQEWEKVAPMNSLDALYWLKIWYDEQEQKVEQSI